jgi:hypothetical protein
MASITQRRTKSGQPLYSVEVRIKGQPAVRETFHGKAAAKEWARNVEDGLRSGRLAPRLEAEKHTLADDEDSGHEQGHHRRNSQTSGAQQDRHRARQEDYRVLEEMRELHLRHSSKVVYPLSVGVEHLEARRLLLSSGPAEARRSEAVPAIERTMEACP